MAKKALKINLPLKEEGVVPRTYSCSRVMTLDIHDMFIQEKLVMTSAPYYSFVKYKTPKTNQKRASQVVKHHVSDDDDDVDADFDIPDNDDE